MKLFQKNKTGKKKNDPNRIVVLGGGESGFGSAVLAKKAGLDVFLSDAGPIAEKYQTRLTEWEIPFEEGGHTEEMILNAGQVIKSPGIPDAAGIVRKVRERNIPVISEIEFAGRYNKAFTICITGSNGKTTTATLAYELLRQGGKNVGLGGNIGDSFAFQVATCRFDWYVLELSSFQLDGMYDFRADISVLLNITPDHLDRYDYDLQKYVDSKFRILRNQGDWDTLIYSADDPLIGANLGKYDLPRPSYSFSVKNREGADSYRDANNLVIHADMKTVVVEMDKLPIKGLHNAANVMAAATAALLAGVEPESILKTLYSFKGVEHRLERVREKDGILYINDSKATNVDAAWYALESMDRPVVWIAGGTDKGNDYSSLASLARDKVKALVCMGLDNGKLMEFFHGKIPVVKSVSSLEAAMDEVRTLAEPGDAVLLSPACASFDLFKNYEDRGKRFKQAVEQL